MAELQRFIFHENNFLFGMSRLFVVSRGSVCETGTRWRGENTASRRIRWHKTASVEKTLIWSSITQRDFWVEGCGGSDNIIPHYKLPATLAAPPFLGAHELVPPGGWHCAMEQNQTERHCWSVGGRAELGFPVESVRCLLSFPWPFIL